MTETESMKRLAWRVTLTAAVLLLGTCQLRVETQAAVPNALRERAAEITMKRARRITNADRLAAAERARAARERYAAQTSSAGSARPASRRLAAVPPQGGTPNYFGPESNWANSPMPTVDPNTGAISGGIRKFVDSLPQLGRTGANNLQQYLPVAVKDTTTYPGSDYYEIALVQYTEKMHSDLNPTTLRGYVQLETPANAGASLHVPLSYPDGTPILDAGGNPVLGVDAPNYLGPIIVSTKDVPTRIKFTNYLPKGAGGDLFIPVDTTEMGAGMGPLGMMPTPGKPMNYTQNRGTLHLHGGLTPWISDGTPHQWITPAGELTDYPKGVSVQNVPDMPDPGDGSMTFFYSNQQSARLMFYHDHAYGITRLNVYAGEAAGYVLTDPTEQDLIARGVLPDLGIPLIIQDKTFLDNSKVLTTDPTWPFALDVTKNNLWYPHVYMPNQNPNDSEGANALGRWDYGPWFWPPWVVTHQPITLPDGTVQPNLPDLSMTMEAFMDTPLVNGTLYPYMNVEPKTYRFRILNAANDRMWNLQLYAADPTAPTEVRMVPAVAGAAAFPAAWTAKTLGQPGDILDGRDGGVPDPSLIGPSMIQIGTEGGFLPAPVVWPNIPIGFNRNPKDITVGNVLEHNLFLGPAERADVLIDFSQFAGQTVILYNDAPAAVPAADSRNDYYTGDVDQTATGGAPTTLPGYGPNTRTILQFRVANSAPAAAYNLAGLQAEFATDPNTGAPGVFARSQDPIIVPQAPYNSAYNGSFPSGTTAYARISSTSLTFTPLGASAPVTMPLGSKAIHELFENEYGRMNAVLGVELPFTNGLNQTTLPFGYIDPPTEYVDDAVTIAPVQSATDGTQLWKITHNGVDTHPIHFHLFNVQLINRVGWDGAVKPPEPNELGWKETVRMNPLEDCIVAFRAVAPKTPFGVPDSVRPLDPTMPIGSTDFFAPWDPLGQPITTTNQLFNFGWEYVWHCHILSHEEMDMMRPIVFNVARSLPPAPVVAGNLAGVQPSLTWTDATSPSPAYPAAGSNWGNPQNEIGFRIERATGSTGTFTPVATAIANSTSFIDNSAAAGTLYQYRVVAFNAAGDSTSNIVTIGPNAPAASSNLTATAQPGPQVLLNWADNSNNESAYEVERSTNGGAFTLIASPGPFVGTGAVSYTDTTVQMGTTYDYRVRAINAGGPSSYSNTATVTVPNVPGAPTSVTAAAGIRQAVVSFAAPASDGGSPITSYTVTSNLGDKAAGTTSPITVTGLRNGTAYTFTVVATNAYGSGPAGGPSASIVTPAVPGAPTNVVATPGNQRATITFTAPAANGSPITRYTVRSNTGKTAVGTASGITMTGLTNGVTYTFTVSATNAVGTGPSSAPSNPVIPATAPGAPTAVSAVAGIGQATVRFTPPASNGGSPITSYTVTAYPGGKTITGKASPITVTGLTNGVSYRFTVMATNVMGSGPASATSAPVRVGSPAAPTNLTAKLFATGVTLSWTDNSTNEQGFRILRSNTNGATWSLAGTVGVNVRTVTYARPPKGTYLYEVQSYNAYGVSAFSNIVKVIVP